MNLTELTESIRQESYRLGFDHCRFLSLNDTPTAPHAPFFEQWLAAGRAGEMQYLARHQDKRRRPARLAGEDSAGFQTMIVLGVSYYQFDLPAAWRDNPSRGIIASYAWGDDYHEIIRPRLIELDSFIRTQTERTTQGKCLVDTGPVLERDWAQRAGMGFTGKNCCTICPGRGSWFFLATVLIPEKLNYDPPIDPGGTSPVTLHAVLTGLPRARHLGSWTLEAADAHRPRLGPDQHRDQFPAAGTPSEPPKQIRATCGRCSRCLDACPTNAFVGPFHLDPQRCISYWTIEASSPVPRNLRSLFGNRIFGCDICQEVCPWNRRLPAQRPSMAALTAKPDRVAPFLLQGFADETPYWLDVQAFAEHFRRSPVKRARRLGMLRNVCIALGNWADPVAVPALRMALSDQEPLARGHAAWALGQIAVRNKAIQPVTILVDRLGVEVDEWVREEISSALDVVAHR